MAKKASDYKVVKKRNGRFSVSKRGGGYLNGEDKVKVLAEAGHIKASKKKEETAESGEDAES